MATGKLQADSYTQEAISNNKHPPFKYANQAYILTWVGSRREAWWQTTHQ